MNAKDIEREHMGRVWCGEGVKRERMRRGHKRTGREARDVLSQSASPASLPPQTTSLWSQLWNRFAKDRKKERTIERGKRGGRREIGGGGGGGGEERRDQNPSSEFLILRNRRRIPERFHSGPAILSISLAPFPGTPTARRARVNGLFGFTDSCPRFSLAFSSSLYP